MSLTLCLFKASTESANASAVMTLEIKPLKSFVQMSVSLLMYDCMKNNNDYYRQWLYN